MNGHSGSVKPHFHAISVNPPLVCDVHECRMCHSFAPKPKALLAGTWGRTMKRLLLSTLMSGVLLAACNPADQQKEKGCAISILDYKDRCVLEPPAARCKDFHNCSACANASAAGCMWFTEGAAGGLGACVEANESTPGVWEITITIEANQNVIVYYAPRSSGGFLEVGDFVTYVGPNDGCGAADLEDHPMDGVGAGTHRSSTKRNVASVGLPPLCSSFSRV